MSRYTPDELRAEAALVYGMPIRRPWSGRYAQRWTAATLAYWGDICHLCGGGGATSADHLTPRSKGGLDTLDNLRPAHVACNSARGAKDLPSTRPVTVDAREWFR